ncbi:pyridoxal phosphate-dependent aminotransferase [Amycolatopsis saalfeldensis]|uniref:Aspartate/methionine/tyrosine aminotransferase n=1 Tax=Amycolatopsis saalfeldensis TaxID=394193 RepID=A0A1H8YP60_9PSEU|nr:pyridoxal phosphate-dependent aminotransferase [Amycolatopsis saalfeldensis]SEP53967.1 Aspartate/methionine/tyrosine aminotransferase [Amycolatopsis saalfeldensis]
MHTCISHRAAAVVTYDYDDVVPAGQLDLRGDNSPPLATAVPMLAQPGLSADELSSYGGVAGDPELRAILGALIGVAGDQVLVTTGGSEALFLALTCVADPGDTVLLPRPAFPGFEQLARLVGLRVVHYDVPGVPPRRRAGEPVVVCTPHNPTGIITTPGISVRDDGWTVWDISHMSLAGRRIADLTAELAAHDILVFSLSKLLRLPGARVGCLVATDPAMLAAATRVKTHLSMSSSRPGQHLAKRILSNPATQDELDTRIARFDDLRGELLDAVAASRGLIAVAAADGTYVFVRTRDGSDAWQRLADAGVVGMPGVVFNSAPDTVRLCIAQSDQIVREAARRVKSL